MIEEQLKGLIAANKTSEAISILTQIVNDRDAQISNDLTLLSGRLAAGERGHLSGRVKFEDFQTLSNQVSSSTLEYIDAVEKEGFLKDIPNIETVKKKRLEGDKTKILFVGSLPKDLNMDFKIEQEYLEIRKLFNNVRERFEATEVFNTTLDTFFDTVRKEKPTILHIAAPADDTIITLHRKNNNHHYISYEFLASAFILFQPNTKCVFINTWCSTIFLKKISTFIGCAIGCKSGVPDDDSIVFSSGFYAALAQGKDYRQAFNFGKELLLEEKQQKTIPKSYGIGSPSYVLPYVLFMNGVAEDANDTTPDDFPDDLSPPKWQ